MRLQARSLACDATTLLAYLACVVALAGVLTGCGGSGSGPLAQRKSARVSIEGVAVSTGQLGVVTLPALGPIPSRATLVDVRPRRSEDARGLAMRYALTRLHISGGGAKAWPPAGWNAHPVDGFVIDPHTQARVMLEPPGANPASTGYAASPSTTA